MSAPLNMDRSQRLFINTTDLDWESSPVEGVWRKKLEREAAESGQVTSIVRYEPGTRFSAHKHPLGEEILVLDGVFSDEHGDYPAGSYLRNPPGSSHAPFSEEGCTILVKLNQFAADDDASIRVRTGECSWRPGLVDGLSVMSLHSHGVIHTALVRWAPGTVFQPHNHPGGEEIFVIEGVFEDEYGQYPTGSWLRNPPWSRHHPFSREGCTLLVKVGHIAE
ncbi:cupin domain-containing protein [Alcanivorax sp. 1008]|uniref:cupin domain-containing protein n=1 Tax=Alcanivorax sp. 1008 TaxID=2816853 RepID=UPI001D27AE42|nr:cupin domain-containing protein [Alcanivorax sp. 1008]MCC1497227.1 cupin domain-containing protein [Alcanivorax sp. 1008]